VSIAKKLKFELSDYFGLCLLLVGLWLASNPYYGIRHDSILYNAQALNKIFPEIYGRDLFFQYGSQDKFTFFPYVHAYFIQCFGLNSANFLLMIIGKIFWVTGLFAFVASIFQKRERWLAMACVLGFSPFYESYNVFSYGESFLTSRIFSEASVLFGLASLVAGQRILACGLLVVASLCHPLITLPAFCIGLFLFPWRSWRLPFVLCGVGGGLVVILGFAGIPPFSLLLTAFDPAWLQMIEMRSYFVFLDSWDYEIFGRFFFLAVLMLLAMQFGQQKVALLARVCLFSAMLFLLVAWVGGEFRNVLITQLQLWRVLWLFQLCGLIILGGVTLEWWKASHFLRMAILTMWACALLDGAAAGYIALAGCVLFLVLRQHLINREAQRVDAIVIALLLCFSIGWKVWYFKSLIDTGFISRSPWITVFTDFLPITLCVFLYFYLVERFGRKISLLTACLGFVVFFWGASEWWIGPNKGAYFDDEAHQKSAEALRRFMPENATIFWPGGMDATWFWLRHPHYFSTAQTAGLLFSRETARHAYIRQSKLYAVGFREEFPWTKDIGNSVMSMQFMPKLVGADLAYTLCKDADLDYLVLPGNTEVEPKILFESPYSAGTLALVGCADLRSSVSVR